MRELTLLLLACVALLARLACAGGDDTDVPILFMRSDAYYEDAHRGNPNGGGNVPMWKSQAWTLLGTSTAFTGTYHSDQPDKAASRMVSIASAPLHRGQVLETWRGAVDGAESVHLVADQRGETLDMHARAMEIKQLTREPGGDVVHVETCVVDDALGIGGLAYIGSMVWSGSGDTARRVFVWTQGHRIRMGACGTDNEALYTAEYAELLDITFEAAPAGGRDSALLGTLAWAELPPDRVGFVRANTIASLRVRTAQLRVAAPGDSHRFTLSAVETPDATAHVYVEPRASQRLAVPLALHHGKLYFATVESPLHAGTPMHIFRVAVHEPGAARVRVVDAGTQSNTTVHSLGVHRGALWSLHRRAPMLGSRIVVQSLATGAMVSVETRDVYGQASVAVACSQPGMGTQWAIVVAAIDADVGEGEMARGARLVEVCVGDGLALSVHTLYGGRTVKRVQTSTAGRAEELWLAEDIREGGGVVTHFVQDGTSSTETRVASVDGMLLGFAHPDEGAIDALHVMHRASGSEPVEITRLPDGPTRRNFVATSLADGAAQLCEAANGTQSVLVASADGHGSVVLTRHMLDAHTHTSRGWHGVEVARWPARSAHAVRMAATSACDVVYAVAQGGVVRCAAPAWTCAQVSALDAAVDDAHVAVDENDVGEVSAVWVTYANVLERVAQPSGAVQTRATPLPITAWDVAAHNGVVVLTSNVAEVTALCATDGTSTDWPAETWVPSPAIERVHASCARDGRGQCDVWLLDGTRAFHATDTPGARPTWSAWPDAHTHIALVSVWPDRDDGARVWALTQNTGHAYTLMAVQGGRVASSVPVDVGAPIRDMTHGRNGSVVWLLADDSLTALHMDEHGGIARMHECVNGTSDAGRRVVFVPEPAPGRLYLAQGHTVNTCVVDAHTACCVEAWAASAFPSNVDSLARTADAMVLVAESTFWVMVNESAYEMAPATGAVAIDLVAPIAVDVDVARLDAGDALRAYALLNPLPCTGSWTELCAEPGGMFVMSATRVGVELPVWEVLVESHDGDVYSRMAMSPNGTHSAVLVDKPTGAQEVQVDGETALSMAHVVVDVAMDNATLWMLAMDDDEESMLLLSYSFADPRVEIAATFSALEHTLTHVAAGAMGHVFVLATRHDGGGVALWAVDVAANAHHTVATSGAACEARGVAYVPVRDVVVWTAQCADGAHMWSCSHSACAHMGAVAGEAESGPRWVPGAGDLVVWFVQGELLGVRAATLAHELELKLEFEQPFTQTTYMGTPTDFVVTPDARMHASFARAPPFRALRGGVYTCAAPELEHTTMRTLRRVAVRADAGTVAWDARARSWVFGQAHGTNKGATPLLRVTEQGDSAQWLPMTAPRTLVPLSLSVGAHSGDVLFVDSATDALWRAPADGTTTHMAMLALGDVTVPATRSHGQEHGRYLVWITDVDFRPSGGYGEPLQRVCVCDLGTHNELACEPQLLGVIAVGAPMEMQVVSIDAMSDAGGALHTVVGMLEFSVNSWLVKVDWNRYARSGKGAHLDSSPGLPWFVAPGTLGFTKIPPSNTNLAGANTNLLRAVAFRSAGEWVVFHLIPGTLMPAPTTLPAVAPVADPRIVGVWATQEHSSDPATTITTIDDGTALHFDHWGGYDPETLDGRVNRAPLTARIVPTQPNQLSASGVNVQQQQSSVGRAMEMCTMRENGAWCTKAWLIVPSPQPSVTPPPQRHSVPVATIAGSVFGAVVGVALLGFVALVALRRRAARAPARRNVDPERRYVTM